MKFNPRCQFLAASAALLSLVSIANAQTLFSDNFDNYSSPVTVTTTGTNNGYAILFGSTGAVDFKAVFGYDYSAVTFPTSIPPAPNSAGTTKGLFVTVNKDATAAVAAVNLFPTNKIVGTNYAVKFDLWINFNDLNTSTEHAMFGINHSGTVMNRPAQTTGSDGLFFVIDGEGGQSGTSATTRDYGCFKGTGSAAPILLTPANTTFGPAPLLGNEFDNTNSGFSTLFPTRTVGTIAVPVGSAGLQWLKGEVRYESGLVTYLLNDTIVAQYTNPTVFTNGNIMVGYNDASSSIGSANNFAIFDNIRVQLLGFPNVSVANTLQPAEGGSAGTFTITRDVSSSLPLTVNYAMSGAASNGVDYTTLTGVAVIPANQNSVDVSLSTIDDSIAEFAEDAILTITPGTNYVIGTPGFAIATISDNETPQLSITATQSTAYEGTPGDYLTFQITRKGDINQFVTANLSYSGTATNGVNFTNVPTVDVPSGVVTQTFTVPVIDDHFLNGNRTVVCTIASGNGYTVGAPASANGTIIDDEMPTEANVVFSDMLASDTSANWTQRAGANNLVADYSAAFGYPVANDSIPNAPSGATSALRVTANKDDITPAGAAGINLYPNGINLSGDFAMRFDLCLVENSIASSGTEFAVFGINHSGAKTNWYRGNGTLATNTPKDCDGLWFAISADGSGSSPGDYALLTGTNASSGPTILLNARSTAFTNIFKAPPFSANTGTGLAAGAIATYQSAPIWVNVEVMKIANIVTLNINKSKVLQFTNNTAFTSGNVMLGYMDPYDSIGNTDGAAYFSNLRVLNLTVVPISISSVNVTGSQVTIKFTSNNSDTASSFTLQSASSVNATPTDVSATITGGAGIFQATVPVSGTTQFYRIHHN